MRKNWLVKNDFMTKGCCVLILMEFKCKRNEEPCGKEVVMLNIPFIYGIKTDDPGMGEWNIKTPSVFQGKHRLIPRSHNELPPDAVLPFDGDLFGAAKMRGNTSNFGLFQRWLRYCEANHHHDVPNFTGDRAIRLIDVQQGCLAEWHGPTSDPPRLVALGYVWDVITQLIMLATENIPNLEEPGFFKSHTVQQTVQDYMDLVSKIGERYLWVDALCILQDSPADRRFRYRRCTKYTTKPS